MIEQVLFIINSVIAQFQIISGTTARGRILRDAEQRNDVTYMNALLYATENSDDMCSLLVSLLLTHFYICHVQSDIWCVTALDYDNLMQASSSSIQPLFITLLCYFMIRISDYYLKLSPTWIHGQQQNQGAIEIVS